MCFSAFRSVHCVFQLTELIKRTLTMFENLVSHKQKKRAFMNEIMRDLEVRDDTESVSRGKDTTSLDVFEKK